MFQALSAKLSDVFQSFSGQRTITQAVIDQGVKTIRRALLEADVATEVIDTLTARFAKEALGQTITKGAKPADMLAKLFYDNLVDVLGKHQNFTLSKKKTNVIMLVGLQGAGKTTFAGRLAQWLRKNDSRRVMLVSADVYRPAAIQQLSILAEKSGAIFHPSKTQQDPRDIVREALHALQSESCDTLIIDTAGRTHVDSSMMQECQDLANIAKPDETLFVLDSMTGQDAAHIAQSFSNHCELTGAVLTKTDSDTRGGAALSVQQITKKPIKFITTGEKLEDIDTFEPERIAQQILGMGDVVGLIKKLEASADPRKAERMMAKFKKNQAFDFEDLRDQLQQMQAMGGMESIMSKLPMFGAIPQQKLQDIADQSSNKPMIDLINSMTPQERRQPILVINKPSRRDRIIRGSGRSTKEMQLLIKQYQRMQKMMQKFRGKKMQGMMGKMQDMFRGGN
ncbi:MAG: signal recognition particle protein [Pseudomonadota bacterium]|nr:signal recognition particle protein [Pseudomonadota bacterium]